MVQMTEKLPAYAACAPYAAHAEHEAAGALREVYHHLAVRVAQLAGRADELNAACALLQTRLTVLSVQVGEMERQARKAAK
jgi:hypothetical protein